MTAKKKTWSYTPLSHDSDHADGGLAGLANLGLTPLAPSTPPAAASMVAKVATWAAADASSTPGSVAAAVLPYTGNTPPPPPPSVPPVDANVEPLTASAQKLAPLAPTVTDKISKVYQHWADGDAADPADDEWNNNILSANKSDYSEGEVIPHVFAFKASSQTPLVPGQTYSFNITYNHYQANTNAGGFVGLDTFNLSRDPNTWPANGAPSADSTFVNNGGTAGMFHTVNADIIDVSAVTYSGTGTKDGHVTVTFVYSGPEQASSGSALIYYGLKIAGPGDVPDQGVGETHGAHLWTGGSLQTTVDIGGSGATSIQLSPAAILVPEMTIDKTVLGVYESDGVTLDSDGIADEAGDIVKYNVRVTNTGEVALTGVTVTDPLTGQDITGVTLALGAFADYASQYTVTQADLDGRGGGDDDIDNTATADSNQTDTVNDSATVLLQYLPVLAIAKSYDGVTSGNDNDKIDLPGEVLNYTVTVTNNGNITLTNVTVIDPLTGQDVSGITLAPGESRSFQTTYTLTQGNLDDNGGGDGDIDNTATADSNETDPVSASAAAPLDFISALQVTKTFLEVTGGNGNAVADFAGDIIRYRVTVTNTDGQSLTNVTIVDPLTGQNVSGITLAAGESQSFDSSYVLQQSDLDTQGGGDGDLDNTATADSDQTDPVSDSEEVPLVYAPALTIDKVVDEITGGNQNGVADFAGDVLNYRVLVRNSGNVTLTGVTVVDPLTGQDLGDITLAVGETQTFASSYTLTQADLDTNGGGDGHIENTATADSNETGPVDDSERVDLSVRPSLSINKVLAGISGGNGNLLADAAGDLLNYDVTVSNLGNVTLTNVSVVDPLTGLSQTGLTLAPGEAQTFGSVYELTQADLDGNGGGDGDIDNEATADSDQTDAISDAETVQLLRTTGLQIIKSFVNLTGGNGNVLADTAGDILNYQVVVSNVGTTTLHNVVTTSSLTSFSDTLSTLLPGESQTYLTSYTLQQADLDNNGGGDGTLENDAVAVADETGPTFDSETVQLFVSPVMFLSKLFLDVTGGNGNSVADAAGDQINYRLILANPGNVTLTNVDLFEPLTGLTLNDLTLAPNDANVYLTSYTLQQSDLDNNGGGDGYIDNIVNATSDQANPVTDGDQVPLLLTRSMSFDAAFTGVTGGNGNALADAAGDVLNFSYAVANLGNVTLTDVSITDPLTGVTVSGVTLAPGASDVYTGSYTLQQSDLDSNGGGDGRVESAATASSNETGLATDNEYVTVIYDPRVNLVKYVSVDGGSTWNDANSPTGPEATSAPQFRFVMSNTGTVTLGDVRLTDSTYDLNGADPGIDYAVGSLAPGQSAELVFTDTLLVAGQQVNSASVSVVGMPTVSDNDNAYYLGVVV